MPKVYTGDLTKMFDISGKKAMIFGGAGGFGEAIAARLRCKRLLCLHFFPFRGEVAGC